MRKHEASNDRRHSADGTDQMGYPTRASQKPYYTVVSHSMDAGGATSKCTVCTQITQEQAPKGCNSSADKHMFRSMQMRVIHLGIKEWQGDGTEHRGKGEHFHHEFVTRTTVQRTCSTANDLSCHIAADSCLWAERIAEQR